ncbi:MAG: hypothetical protein K1000chlam2_01124 [Chlamydiae bacterium]|nr:hypothetical protein [Chlamydiota bacterium]
MRVQTAQQGYMENFEDPCSFCGSAKYLKYPGWIFGVGFAQAAVISEAFSEKSVSCDPKVFVIPATLGIIFCASYFFCVCIEPCQQIHGFQKREKSNCIDQIGHYGMLFFAFYSTFQSITCLAIASSACDESNIQ